MILSPPENHSAPEGRTGSRRLGGVAVAVLAFFALLAVAEIATRLFISSPSTAHVDPRYGLVQPPHARVVYSLEGRSSTRLNAYGLFDRELLPHPRYRALLLGDSYSEAQQVGVARNFSTVAEREAPGLEVVNAGQSGRSPANEAAYLADYDAVFRPDLVVVQVSDGDVDDLLDYARHPESLPAAGSAGGSEPAAPSAVPSDNLHGGGWVAAVRGLMRRSALVTLATRRLVLLGTSEEHRLSRHFGEPAPAEASVSPQTAPVDARVEPILDALYREMAAVNPHIVFLYIPNLVYFDGPCHNKWPARRAFYRRFCARRGIPLVDTSDSLIAEYARTGQPMNGFNNSLIGSGHLNTRGHRVVGKALAREIEREMAGP